MDALSLGLYYYYVIIISVDFNRKHVQHIPIETKSYLLEMFPKPRPESCPGLMHTTQWFLLFCDCCLILKTGQFLFCHTVFITSLEKNCTTNVHPNASLPPLQTSSVSEVEATPQKTDVPSSSPSAASEQDVSVHLVLPLTFQLCAYFLSW